jgi:hypothetical protein
VSVRIFVCTTATSGTLDECGLSLSAKIPAHNASVKTARRLDNTGDERFGCDRPKMKIRGLIVGGVADNTGNERSTDRKLEEGKKRGHSR